MRAIAPSSPFEREVFERGVTEIERLGFRARYSKRTFSREGYFAGSVESRAQEFRDALEDTESRAIFCARGGFGAAEIIPAVLEMPLDRPKIFMGFSDATVLQTALWQRAGWVSLYGPMVAAGLSAGADAADGYDAASLLHGLQETRTGWTIALQGETLTPGTAEGIVLGGCMTMVKTTLGTPWELDTAGSILLLEDRAMKPYQVDRSLLHLQQAGKFNGVRGVILGEFPECEPPNQGGVSLRDVFLRRLGGLGIPIVSNAPIGHARRPMLTVPLGVQARIHADADSWLEILEPACSEEGG